MGDDNGFHTEIDMDTMHGLREGLTLTKGWLEALFRGWEDLDESHRQEMVAAALLGANQMAFLIEQLSGERIDEIRLPHERMAEEFLRLVESRSADK
jgi:hypothetical protein